MPANAIQKTVAFDREASFADSSAKNWDSLTANGDVILVHNLNYGGIRRPKIPNANLKQRAGATRPAVLGLRNHEFSFDWYWNANSANAAEAAQAARTAQDELLLNALGGEHRGYAAGIAAGSAASPTVEDAHGDTLEEYGWNFFWDTSASLGYFRQYSTVTEGVGSDTLTMATGHDLPFTPDAGGADIAYACVAHYPHWDALEDHSHSLHTSLTFFFKGRHTEHSVESKGCKLGVNMGPIEQGTIVDLSFSGLGTTFDADGITQPALTVTPEGSPGSVVGSGTNTLCHMATSAATLAAQTFWGPITPTFGIMPDRVGGPNGTEGVHGHGVTEDSFDASGIEMTVPFDDSWITAYHAETTYHMLVQIGTAITGSRFLYCPLLSFSEEPEKVSVGGRDGLTLRFTMLERDVAQGSLSEAEWHRARAKFTLGRVG
jgi:hypothetical protein